MKVEYFEFAPGSPEVNAVGGGGVDAAGRAFSVAQCDGGKSLQLQTFTAGVGFETLLTIDQSVWGKFGPSTCFVIGPDVLLCMSVRDATGKQRLAKAWVRGVAACEP